MSDLGAVREPGGSQPLAGREPAGREPVNGEGELGVRPPHDGVFAGGGPDMHKWGGSTA